MKRRWKEKEKYIYMYIPSAAIWCIISAGNPFTSLTCMEAWLFNPFPLGFTSRKPTKLSTLSLLCIYKRECEMRGPMGIWKVFNYLSPQMAQQHLLFLTNPPSIPLMHVFFKIFLGILFQKEKTFLVRCSSGRKWLK